MEAKLKERIIQTERLIQDIGNKDLTDERLINHHSLNNDLALMYCELGKLHRETFWQKLKAKLF